MCISAEKPTPTAYKSVMISLIILGAPIVHAYLNMNESCHKTNAYSTQIVMISLISLGAPIVHGYLNQHLQHQDL